MAHTRRFYTSIGGGIREETQSFSNECPLVISNAFDRSGTDYDGRSPLRAGAEAERAKEEHKFTMKEKAPSSGRVSIIVAGIGKEYQVRAPAGLSVEICQGIVHTLEEAGKLPFRSGGNTEMGFKLAVGHGVVEYQGRDYQFTIIGDSVGIRLA